VSYMLDTNMCAFITQRNESVLAAVRNHRQDGLFISAITLSELEHGVRNSQYVDRNRIALNNILVLFTVLPYGSQAAVEYGSIRADLQKRGCLIGNMDMLIAAHAKSAKLTLVTNNTREFQRVPGLAIEDWKAPRPGL